MAPETDAICNTLALDPLKLIASCALLVAVAPDRADSILKAVEAAELSNMLGQKGEALVRRPWYFTPKPIYA